MARAPSVVRKTGDVRRGDAMPWRAALAASIVVCTTYPLVASGHVVARNVLYNVAELGAIVAIVLGVRRYRPRAPHAWLLIAGGIVMLFVGDTIWAVYEINGRNPYPSSADIFYLASYPLFAAGLAVATRK